MENRIWHPNHVRPEGMCVETVSLLAGGADRKLRQNINQGERTSHWPDHSCQLGVGNKEWKKHLTLDK